jgi:hypothetical protein
LDNVSRRNESIFLYNKYNGEHLKADAELRLAAAREKHKRVPIQQVPNVVASTGVVDQPPALQILTDKGKAQFNKNL